MNEKNMKLAKAYVFGFLFGVWASAFVVLAILAMG